jgi:hypothetical protein
MTSKKISSACTIASCINEIKLNSCIGKRDPDATTEIVETPEPNANGRIFFSPMDDRYGYIRLFQDTEINQNKIELHDIAVKFEIISYHRQGIEDTFNLLQD